MERSQNQSKEVLQASLFLSILKHTRDHVPRGDEDARSEDVWVSSSHAPPPAYKPCDPDPQLVPRVNALIDSIGQCRGSFEKRVTASDIAGQQNRLMLVKEHVRELVLPLLRTGDDPGTGIEVKTFNTKGKTYPMLFKLWCSKVYVLTSDWKVFVRENQLGVLGCPDDMGVQRRPNPRIVLGDRSEDGKRSRAGPDGERTQGEGRKRGKLKPEESAFYSAG